ncbi:hypothetical protein HYALB_00001716 [Hymenoscyphus albidus]|uniref:Casein kinase II subunit beta n=1 Tax=Hymenoscyphus albidus TaxID=595503 RepID=A0A9N9Q225_9HELO|nr:hypothetical protein HYALB_00001716 [Hymenoscyphus albidus]
MDDFNSETDSDYTSYWRDWGAQPPGHASVPSKTPHPVGSFAHEGLYGVVSAVESSDDLDDLVDPLNAGFLEVAFNMIAIPYLRQAGTREAVATFSPKAKKILPMGFAWASDFGTRFISSRGNEYFCEIDEDYLTDRFNLTGLNTEVQYYQYALDLVTDVFDLDCDDDMRETIEKSARHLYGLVHARYIVTTRGLAKMLEKYKKADFGKCPRVMCKSHPLLPMGQSDNPNVKAVKLYCARCEDIYNPKSSRHSAIDGAYFGTSFHNIIFQVYPALIPAKSYERYSPRIYGFKVHAPATLIRWQHSERDEMRKRLRKLEIESGFKDDEEDVAEDSEEEEEETDMVLENGTVEVGGANQL